MADLSWTDLKVRTARKLRIIADSEPLSTEDGDVIGQGLLSVQETLSRLGLVSLDVENGIEEPYADPVAAMAAAQLVDEFQVPEPYATKLVGNGLIGLPGRSLAERRLRYLLDGVTVKLASTTDGTVF